VATNPVTMALRIAEQGADPSEETLLRGSKALCLTNRMLEWGTSGSVGGLAANRQVYPANDGEISHQ
jgi:hypothetical protein